MLQRKRERQTGPRKVRTLIYGVLAALASTWVLFSGGSTVHAQTATGNLTVQITVTAGCAISASTLNFGSVLSSALVSAVTGSTTISVTCTNGSPYSIGLDNGANALATQRRMINGANYLNYQLFTDAGRTIPWTTGANSTTCTVAGQCITSTGTGTAQNFTVYGSAIAVLPVAAGSYSDTVTMTVTY